MAAIAAAVWVALWALLQLFGADLPLGGGR
jgi:hypothetical protein